MRFDDDTVRYGMWLATHADPNTPVSYGTIGTYLHYNGIGSNYARRVIASWAIPVRRQTPRTPGHRRGRRILDEV